MKIVITGGAGFLGRRLAQGLVERGALPEPTTGRDAAITEIVLFDAVEAAPPSGGGAHVIGIVGDVAERGATRAAIAGASYVFHLAAVVSAAAEAELDLGMRVNIQGTIAVLDACRACPAPPRLVFTSSIAVYGPAEGGAISDCTPPAPRSSYGAQKAIGELLVADYSRRGLIDGRAVRLPTIVVRPGKPNKAASSFASGIIREPLAGAESVCPVARDTRLWILSPRGAVAALVHAAALPAEVWAGDRVLMLPGIDVGVGEMVAALERAGGRAAAQRIRWQPDPAIARIVDSWPHRFAIERASRLGFRADGGIDAIIATHVEDELGGRVAA